MQRVNAQQMTSQPTRLEPQYHTVAPQVHRQGGRRAAGARRDRLDGAVRQARAHRQEQVRTPHAGAIRPCSLSLSLSLSLSNYQPTGYGAGCGIYSNGKWVQKYTLRKRILI